MPTSIGVPTVGGIQRSLVNYGMGAVGGLIYNVVSKVTGSSLIGGAAAAGVAGATMRGNVGETLATMAGFAVGSQGLGSLTNFKLPFGLGGGSSDSEDDGMVVI